LAPACGLNFLNVSKENITSSGVTGVPSCHFAVARSLKEAEEKSSG